MIKFCMKFAVLLLIVLGMTASVAAQGIFNPENGHHYLFVELDPSLTWAEARDFAETFEWMGMQGHLATITSPSEQSFIEYWFNGEAWLGGYQLENQSATDAGWQWITGEPWSYTNWDSGEPNDCCTDGENNEENYLMTFEDLSWNDNNSNDHLGGMLVEFENCVGSVCYVPCIPVEQVDGACQPSYCNVYVPGLTNPINVGQINYLVCDGPCPPSTCVVFVPIELER